MRINILMAAFAYASIQETSAKEALIIQGTDHLLQESEYDQYTSNGQMNLIVKPKVHNIKLGKDPMPFRQNFTMEMIGTVLMFLLIGLSNAGGLSGAGSNIPLLLIFYSMEMDHAVPLSASVAVVATTLRFCITFFEVHPNDPKRNLINYEMVQVSMPFVFFGSFMGVILGKMIGSTWQVVLFEITVAWSIFTTFKKAIQAYQKEKSQGDGITDSLLSRPSVGSEVGAINESEKQLDIDIYAKDVPVELQAIYTQEKYHFTLKRGVFLGINLTLLIITQILFKNEDSPIYVKYGSMIFFGLAMCGMTYWAVKDVDRTHQLKEQHNYEYDEQDFRFKSIGEIVKLAVLCMVAAILCGATGIAGGMVLGPLFLTYNMIPQVMSATNQFITLIASIAVSIQFVYLGKVWWQYAGVFACITFISAGLGIRGVNAYVKRSGKQSVILFILFTCLLLAFLSIPLEFLLFKKSSSVSNTHGAHN